MYTLYYISFFYLILLQLQWNFFQKDGDGQQRPVKTHTHGDPAPTTGGILFLAGRCVLYSCSIHYTLIYIYTFGSCLSRKILWKIPFSFLVSPSFSTGPSRWATTSFRMAGQADTDIVRLSLPPPPLYWQTLWLLLTKPGKNLQQTPPCCCCCYSRYSFHQSSVADTFLLIWRPMGMINPSRMSVAGTMWWIEALGWSFDRERAHPLHYQC